MTSVSPVLWQHADEAAVLWLRRDRAIGEPHYRLPDLAKLDGRLEANLDGLRIGEVDPANAAWNACERELRWEEPGEVFPAAVLALESPAAERLQKVLDLATTSDAMSRPLVSALGWLPWARAVEFVERLLRADHTTLRRVGIAASAICRCDPGQSLAVAVADPEHRLRARALRAVGELGRLDLLGALREHLGQELAGCRFAAAWSAALLAGDADGLHALRQIVEASNEQSPAALQLVVRRMQEHEAKPWLLELATQGPVPTRMAVIGAGAIGTVAFAPWLFQQMETPALARAAGEAFAMFTGVDIAYQDLDGPWPEGFEAGPTEDPEDANVDLDADENLPWPDVEKLAAWWQEHRSNFDPRTRFLCGRPMTDAWLEHVLRHGYQRQRAAAALELAIRRPGRPLFNVRAPGFRQQAALGLK